MILLSKSECWGNKGDGILLNMMKINVINCKIKLNSSGAIKI